MSLAIIKNRHTQRGNDPKTTAAFLLVRNPKNYVLIMEPAKRYDRTYLKGDTGL